MAKKRLLKHLAEYTPPTTTSFGWLDKLEPDLRDEVLDLVRLFHDGKLAGKFRHFSKFCEWLWAVLEKENQLPGVTEKYFMDSLRRIKC